MGAATAALASIAPPGVRTGCRTIAASDVVGMHDDEAASVAAAVPKRRYEFATGRALLRALLDVDITIPVGADRSPQLPAGFVGSLAHTGRLAVAAVAPVAVAAALGIDVEPVTVLDGDMARVILRPDEIGLDAHCAFTLKEVVYKAWSTLGGGIIDHHDVRLEIDEGGSFHGTVVELGTRFAGRFTVAAGHWFALVAVPAATGRRLDKPGSLRDEGREEDGTASAPTSN